MNDLTQITQTFVSTKAGLSAGTTTTYTTANTVQYAIKGKAFSKAAVTNGATPVVDVAFNAAFKPQPIGTGSVYVLGFDAAGTLRVTQGSIETLDITGAFVRAPQFPSPVDAYAPFAYMVVRAAPATAAVPAVATWTFGTNNNSGVTGVTITFTDIMVLPDRPQIA